MRHYTLESLLSRYEVVMTRHQLVMAHADEELSDLASADADAAPASAVNDAEWLQNFRDFRGGGENNGGGAEPEVCNRAAEGRRLTD